MNIPCFSIFIYLEKKLENNNNNNNKTPKAQFLLAMKVLLNPQFGLKFLSSLQHLHWFLFNTCLIGNFKHYSSYSILSSYPFSGPYPLLKVEDWYSSHIFHCTMMPPETFLLLAFPQGMIFHLSRRNVLKQSLPSAE